MEQVRVNCYNCTSNRYSEYLSENGFQLVKCRKCGLLYVNPRPAENEIIYATRIGTHKGHNELNVTGEFEKGKIGNYLDILNSFFSPNELKNKYWIDIGCGHGEFLEALQIFSSNQIKLIGFEPNEAKAKSAELRGFQITKDIESLEINFDFISILNVYSHLTNPIEEIKKWKSTLTKNGKMLIETGNTSHLPSFYHPRPLLLPDHLSFANKRIVTSILRRNGFKHHKTILLKTRERVKFRLIRFIKDIIVLLIKGEKKILRFTKKYNYLDMYILSELVQ